jgi:hypothetical protein
MIFESDLVFRIIRATGSSGSISDSEEYIVDFSSTTEHGSVVGFKGSGIGTTGKSKHGCNFWNGEGIFNTLRAMSPTEWKAHSLELKRCLLIPLFSRLSVESNSEALSRQAEALRMVYSPPLQSNSERGVDFLPWLNKDFLQEFVMQHGSENQNAAFDPEMEDHVAAVDEKVNAAAGGTGSLASLCHYEYQSACRLLICVFVHHCGLGKALRKSVGKEQVPDELKAAWCCALKILEDGVRRSLSKKSKRTSPEKAGDLWPNGRGNLGDACYSMEGSS